MLCRNSKQGLVIRLGLEVDLFLCFEEVQDVAYPEVQRHFLFERDLIEDTLVVS